MAAKSDGMLKMKKSDVAFTPLQNSDHSGSVQGLVSGSHPGSGAGDGGCSDGGSRCCCSRVAGGAGGGGGSPALCLRLAREQQRYSVWDCLWILAAMAVYFADVGSDIWLSVDYYLRGQRWWFGLTLFFVVLGSLSVQLFSFRWFVHDFSTENSAQCSPVDGKTAAAPAEVDVRPSTPQRQASTASNKANNPAGVGSSSRAASPRSASCSCCIWFLQSFIHILQLGQLWRWKHRLSSILQLPPAVANDTEFPESPIRMERWCTGRSQHTMEGNPDVAEGNVTGPRKDLPPPTYPNYNQGARERVTRRTYKK
ncbi:XK-related protein 4-like [Bufo gargarizans]|uniref:XK-related protein 4-like n=1 Tax=Bufo gargarizans TaxID=30331 RepID=UPI001CF17541|nr:XK-related protein 4-like [Bufo gargarizans]